MSDPGVPAIDLGRTLRYYIVDVFTDRAFAGNPLAVVLDADGLSTGQCQALAGEFNLSETAFPLPATPGSGADYLLRIFTPTTELPFAGHPSVGAAWLLRALGRLPAAGEVHQECGAGILPLLLAGRTVTLTGAAPVLGEPLDPGPLLAAVDLATADLDPLAPPRVAGCGISFVFLPVRRDAVDRAIPQAGLLGSLAPVSGLSLSAWDSGAAYARVFPVGVGVGEDPATGSAALGYGGWLVASGLVRPDGVTSYVVAQGHAMQRPSLLRCQVEARAGRAVRATVSGGAVAIAEGRIAIPPL